MRYTRISADCHVDLCWLPPHLFTSSASAAMKDRMPYVTDRSKGPRWVTNKGVNLGLVNGMGSAGREYVPGKIQRSDRMDAEWEDQFKDLSLTMRPSEYWRRQCRATYQTDRIGIKLLDDLGHDTIMWGSDFPHPDGVWPDSSEYIERELGHLPTEVRDKVVCEKAGKLYGFIE
jgi:hypothetical protein